MNRFFLVILLFTGLCPLHSIRAQDYNLPILSPVDFYHRQRAVMQNLASDEAIVVFSGLKTGDPGQYLEVNPVFTYLTGVAKPFSALVLLAKSDSFQNKYGQSFIFHADDQVAGLARTVDTQPFHQDRMLKNPLVFSGELWPDFLTEVLEKDSIARIRVFDPEGYDATHIGFSPLQQEFYRRLGAGEMQGARAYRLFAKIQGASPANFAQVQNEINANLNYYPSLQSSHILKEIASAPGFEDIQSFLPQIGKMKISLEEDPGFIFKALPALFTSDERTYITHMPKVCERLLLENLKDWHNHKSAQGWTDKLSLEMKTRIFEPTFSAMLGPASFSLLTYGKDLGYFYPNYSDKIQESDWVRLEVGPRYGCYRAEIARTIPADKTFEGVKKALLNWVAERHKSALAHPKDLVEGRTYKGNPDPAELVSFLNENGINLSRNQQKNLLFASEVKVAAVGPLANPGGVYKDGIWVVHTYLLFPENTFDQLEISGFGIVLKDVIEVKEGAITHLSKEVPMTSVQWEAFWQ